MTDAEFFPPALTPEEHAELTARPPPCKLITPAQMVIRKRIAAANDTACYNHALQTAPQLAELYRKYPPSKFYTNASGTACKRIYGFFQTKEGEFRAHSVTLLMMFNNDTIDGVPVADLRALDDWTPALTERLNLPCYAQTECFLDPLGWLSFLP